MPALEIAALPVVAALAVLTGDSDAFVPAVVLHAVAWLVGRAGRSRRETEQALRDRDREQAVTAERAWMAMELPDAVGHAVTVMVTHPGAARLTLGEDRPPARSLRHPPSAGGVRPRHAPDSATRRRTSPVPPDRP